MNDLNKQLGDNIGGFNSLQIIDVKNINSIPNPVDYVISGIIDVKIAWTNIAFTPKSLKFSEGEFITDKGIIYKPIISLFHPKDTSISLKIIQDYLQRNLIAKITDNNGNTKIIGSIVSPLRFKYKLVTNAKYDSRPGYNISIYGLSQLPSLFFTGVTTITP